MLAFGLLTICSSPSPAQTPEIEPVRTSITVSETIEAEAPAAITALDRAALERLPGVNLDDRLRAIPGFTLLRRSSSLAANPTTQGVSLRAVGSNGASRTLVLLDGIPVNDPFGSWVFWSRIDPEEIERAEVVRGASSSVFGDRAMGGAISLFLRDAARPRTAFSYEAGNRNTHEAAASAARVWRALTAAVNLRAFTTDGYFIVPESVRGAVDTPAAVRFVAGAARFGLLSGAQRLTLRLDALAEERANGTVLQRNSTSVGTLSANYSRQWGATSVSALAYHTREEYRASFSAVAANRQSERLTAIQSVPAEATGGAVFITRTGARGTILAGSDFERVEGYNSGEGGIRNRRAAFVQGSAPLGPVRWYGGARQNWTGGGDRFFSPHAGLAAGKGPLRLRGSVYRAFRAPTLNELYREFRVGNAVTRANPALTAERLFGAEAGFDLAGEQRRLSVSAFRNELDGLITNVTLSAGPNGITRERQNAAGALARGVEVAFHQHWRNWHAEASYLFADSRFVSRLRVPQIPKHQGNARLTWSRGATTISAGVLSYGLQFEDDVNQFRLPGFATVQAYARREIAAGVSITAAVENLGNREYLAGFTPTPMIGAPRLWRVGLRWTR